MRAGRHVGDSGTPLETDMSFKERQWGQLEIGETMRLAPQPGSLHTHVTLFVREYVCVCMFVCVSKSVESFHI